MVILFGAWVGFSSYAEHVGNPAVAAAGIKSQPRGNMEGKEVRFGDTQSALYDIASTQTSTGSVDGANDSYTAMGGFGLLTGMMLGEVTPGGTGSGLYTILLYAIIAVFIGGLMIGRTPEYIRKKIQAREVKLAGLGIARHADDRAHPDRHRRLGRPRAARARSITARTGSPRSSTPSPLRPTTTARPSLGSRGNTQFYNVIGGIDMLLGRFGIMIPALALAGSLAIKGTVAESIGTFRTDNGMFVGLVIGVILIIGGLTFFPAVSLGPIVEQLIHGKFF